MRTLSEAEIARLEGGMAIVEIWLRSSEERLLRWVYFGR